jgi:hypothetical protein
VSKVIERVDKGLPSLVFTMQLKEQYRCRSHRCDVCVARQPEKLAVQNKNKTPGEPEVGHRDPLGLLCFGDPVVVSFAPHCIWHVN